MRRGRCCGPSRSPRSLGTFQAFAALPANGGNEPRESHSCLEIRCGVIGLNVRHCKNGWQRVWRLALLGHPITSVHQAFFRTYVLGGEDPVVTGTHCGFGVVSPAGLGLGWLLVQMATLFSLFFKVLFKHHAEEQAAEGLVGSGPSHFQKLSLVWGVVLGFSAVMMWMQEASASPLRPRPYS